MFHTITKVAVVLILIMLINDNVFARISCVSGFVTDPNGNPVVRGDLDFDDVITGERLYTPLDNTDANGFYSVCVPDGIYNISYAPPKFTHLLGYQIFNDTLFGAFPQIDVTLEFGKVISGTVRDINGSPIDTVDFDADDLATSLRIYTPNDNSDSTGSYWVVIPRGDYRFRYQPPRGSRWLGLQIDTVSVSADTVIDVILYQGITLSGYVQNSLGQGLPNISVDFRDAATGAKVYLPYNVTDSTGHYNFAAPTGLYQVRFTPPIGSRYVGVAIDSVSINGDTTIDQTLETGWLVSAFVHDSSGVPIYFANIDIIQESSGNKLYTPYDKTDTLGRTTMTLRPDIYTFRVQPPVGSIFDRLVINGVNINADTSMEFTMAEVPKVNLTGRIVNALGDGLDSIFIDLSDTAAGDRIYVANNSTDSAGYYSMMVPIGEFDINIAPVRGSRYVGIDLGRVAFSQDTSWSDIVLESGFIFSGQVSDPQGNPVELVDFDFILESTGAIVYTPHDNTDADGMAIITVAPGIYTIDLNPPLNLPLERRLISGFNVHSDTSVTFFLTDSGNPSPIPFLLKNNSPNPFLGSTNISYTLFTPLKTSIMIYNSLGQRVRVIDNGFQQPGFYLTGWNGTDDRGNTVASGVYFYQLKTSMGSDTQRMLFLK